MDSTDTPADGLTPAQPPGDGLTAAAEGETSAQATEEQTDRPQISVDGMTAASSAPEKSGKKPEDTLTELPFQLMIEYTDLDGAKALLVRSQTKPITRDRQVAEKGEQSFIS